MSPDDDRRKEKTASPKPSSVFDRGSPSKFDAKPSVMNSTAQPATRNEPAFDIAGYKKLKQAQGQQFAFGGQEAGPPVVLELDYMKNLPAFSVVPNSVQEADTVQEMLYRQSFCPTLKPTAAKLEKSQWRSPESTVGPAFNILAHRQMMADRRMKAQKLKQTSPHAQLPQGRTTMDHVPPSVSPPSPQYMAAKTAAPAPHYFDIKPNHRDERGHHESRAPPLDKPKYTQLTSHWREDDRQKLDKWQSPRDDHQDKNDHRKTTTISTTSNTAINVTSGKRRSPTSRETIKRQPNSSSDQPRLNHVSCELFEIFAARDFTLSLESLVLALRLFRNLAVSSMAF